MPADLLSEAEAFLDALGYAQEARVRDYPVWLGRLGGVSQAHLVAFAHRAPQDMSTAVISLELGPLEAGFEKARVLAAPYFLLADDSSLDLWLAGGGSPVLWRREVGQPDVSDLIRWLRPESAMKSKLGLRQLPLFDVPVNLLAEARSDSADRLGPIVADALATSTDQLSTKTAPSRRVTRIEHRAAARLVVGALTALVLRDREHTFLRQLSSDDLLTQVAADHPETFRWLPTMTPLERAVLRNLLEALGAHIDYQSLDTSILSYVYEEALVDDADRRDLGIYYTPPKLANQLLEYMPVELIPPEERYVLDPACGSGTLLVAGHDRLRELQPSEWTSSRRHEDLAVHMRGFDVDPFAAEIARLTLFLHAQPAGNGWRIEDLDTTHQPSPVPPPRLLVTNPPWRYTSETERTQVADFFVSWSADALPPGGLLGMLLPASWLGARTSSPAREKLRTGFEVFEIWRLAQGAFANSRSATAVVLARKNDGLAGRGARAISEVSRRQLPSFLDDHRAMARYLQPGNTFLGAGPSLPRVEAPTVSLGAIAAIRSGAQPLPGAKDRVVSGIGFLNHFRDVRAYAVVDTAKLWRLEFPADFAGLRGADVIGKKKVLASAARSSEGPWRFRVAIDLHGVAMRNSMRGIAPHDQDDEELLYALAIVIGSAFASTFAATYAGDRNIPAKVLPALPVPTSRDAIELLASYGRAAALTDSTDKLGATLVEAENAVWQAYGVNDAERQLAIGRFTDEPAPEGVPRYTQQGLERARIPSTIRRVGVVLDVDGMYLRLWVNGVTPSDGVSVRLPVRMPGWMARPGATFDVRGVDELGDLEAGVYSYQPMAWQDVDLARVQPAPLFFLSDRNDRLR